MTYEADAVDKAIGRKSVCSRHEVAFEIECPYCEKPQGAVGLLAVIPPVAAVTFTGARLRCTMAFGAPNQCTEAATWEWTPVSPKAKASPSAHTGCRFCDAHHAMSAMAFSGGWYFEKLP